MTQGKTILILGGGIGGVVAASLLRRALPREHSIVLVEQADTHLFQPSLLWLMLGLRAPAQISRPYTALAQRGIELVQGRVERIAIGWLNRNSLLYRQKAGSGAYRGATWHTPQQVRALFHGLPVANLKLTSAVFLPGGGWAARAVEYLLPNRLPWGALLIAAGDKA